MKKIYCVICGSTLLCLTVKGIGVGGQIANFGKKIPQVYLITVRGWPKNTPSYFDKSW